MAMNNTDAHSHIHGEGKSIRQLFVWPAVSFLLLMTGIIMDSLDITLFMSPVVRLIWYVAAFLPVGLPVLKDGYKAVGGGDIFNELTLMALASVGAFFIGEYPEGVAVMLFYIVGETLQHHAVDKATRDISDLLDVRSETATVSRGGESIITDPRKVSVGEIITVKPGERVPLDGEQMDNGGLFDTSALTGESVPRFIGAGEEVLAGMISLNATSRIKVTREYDRSALARILDLVKHAAGKKAHAELFIRKFARIYTPVVMALAALTMIVPAIIGVLDSEFDYVFADWLYRALVFLVISCPCALVISIPLGYFAGIGAASRAGILFKGGNYLEAVTHIDTVAFDKTGTLTTGQFSVDEVVCVTLERSVLLSYMAAVESHSSHPLAKALTNYVIASGIDVFEASSMCETAGQGVKAMVNGTEVVAGNLKMLEKYGIVYPDNLDFKGSTIIACGVDRTFAGFVLLSDTLKPDAAEAVEQLHGLGIRDVVMLSGDKTGTVKSYADRLGITEAHGDMLPEDKARYVEDVASKPDRAIAFVGDGLNDAPVLALSNVGIAMGGFGSDAAIESADVVIQTDAPSKVATAIKIGRTTHTIVTENIAGAIGIKAIILGLGLVGYASLWAAVFADVGVAMLAVLNSMRIMWKKY